MFGLNSQCRLNVCVVYWQQWPSNQANWKQLIRRMLVVWSGTSVAFGALEACRSTMWPAQHRYKYCSAISEPFTGRSRWKVIPTGSGLLCALLESNCFQTLFCLTSDSHRIHTTWTILKWRPTPNGFLAVFDWRLVLDLKILLTALFYEPSF